ncbi:MAG: NADPH:quinone reductase [Candidatus Omnitrophota bacterium]|nr:NADPH:quinone reductase [Candidatus Omnitrophota bacterium]MDZ4242004.1 NADPH:quinone reductase [Candidatus Omnitrophota bacterium]
MKAICVEQFGGPDVMRLMDLPDPVPRAGEILVEVKAAGINPVDTYIRSGQYSIKPILPYTPGLDGAGVVVAVGEGVAGFSTGNRVFISGSVSGTYASLAACTKDQIYPLPDPLTFEQGAAIGIPYLTAYRALFFKAKAGARETVLIHGGSGGVGIAAIQLAKANHLKILATAGTPRGLDLVRGQGVDAAFDHSQPGYLDEIRAFQQDRGVDIILEMAAHKNLGEDLTLLAKNGRLVIIGSRGPVSLDPRAIMSREAVVLGLMNMSLDPSERAKAFAAIVLALNKNIISPVISRRFPLTEAPQAHETVMQPGAAGKIVLIPAP